MANVIATTIEGLGMFVGPALAGLVLAVSGMEATLVVMAVALLWSALLVLPIKETPPVPGAGGHPPFREFLFAGFSVTWRSPDLRLLTGVLSGQALTAGCINVLIVVTALALLEIGEGGVGLLDAAVGLGALVGAVVIVPLVHRTRLTIPLVVGAMLWGLPLVAIAAWPNVGVAIGALLRSSASATRSSTSPASRSSSESRRTTCSHACSASWRRCSTSPSASARSWRRCSWRPPVRGGRSWPSGCSCRSSSSGEPGGSSASTRMPSSRCTSWSCSASCRCSRRCHSCRSSASPGSSSRWRPPAGTAVIVQGDEGDRFYVIDEGEVEVVADGRHIASLGRGDGFGEIALIRDVPRTATVTARTPVKLYALERDAFLAAVTGHSASEEAADALIVSRMSSIRG